MNTISGNTSSRLSPHHHGIAMSRRANSTLHIAFLSTTPKFFNSTARAKQRRQDPCIPTCLPSLVRTDAQARKQSSVGRCHSHGSWYTLDRGIVGVLRFGKPRSDTNNSARAMPPLKMVVPRSGGLDSLGAVPNPHLGLPSTIKPQELRSH